MAKVGKKAAGAVDAGKDAGKADGTKAAKAASTAAKAAAAAEQSKASLNNTLAMIATMRGAEGYDTGKAIASLAAKYGPESVVAGIKEFDAAKGGTYLSDLIPAFEEAPATNLKDGADAAVTSVDAPPATEQAAAPAPARKKRKTAAEKAAEKAAAEEAAKQAATAEAEAAAKAAQDAEQAANAGQPTPAEAEAATQAVQGVTTGNSAANIRSMSQQAATYIPPWQRTPQPQGTAAPAASQYNPRQQAAPQAPAPAAATAPVSASDMIAQLDAWLKSGGQASASNQMTNRMNAWVQSQNNPANAPPITQPSSSNNIRNMLQKTATSAATRVGAQVGKSLDNLIGWGVPATVLGTAAYFMAPTAARAYRDTKKGIQEGLAEPVDPNAETDEQRLMRLQKILNGGIDGSGTAAKPYMTDIDMP